MTFHNTKSINVSNFLAMNRFMVNLTAGDKSKYLHLSARAFYTFFKKLEDLDVRYIAVGDLALAFHGLIDISKGLEIWMASEQENLRKASTVVKTADPPDNVIKTTINSTGEDFNLTMYQELTYFSPEKFNWCYVKAEELRISDLTVPVLSLDDVIVEKTVSNDPRDKMIVEVLESMSW